MNAFSDEERAVTPRRDVTARAHARAPMSRAITALTTSALAAVSLGACSHGAGAESGPRIVVSNEDDGTIAVIDARSHELIATIPVGKRPRGLRVAPDGKTLYVALSGSPKAGPGVDAARLPPPDRTADGIGVVDLARLALVRVIPSGQDPESFDLAGGELLVVSNEETAEASIVDLARRELRGRVPAGAEPEGVTTAPDGLVWVTSEAEHRVTVIDPARGAAVASIATGLRPRSIAFTPDGALGLVTGELDASITVIDARARRSIGRIEIPRETAADAMIRPMGIAVAPDGRRAYVTTGRGGSIAVIDLPARRVARLIRGVGARPWGIAVGPGGALYAANGPSNDVAVVDPDAGAVVRRIPAGGSPWGVAVVP
jgi:YVTN family beta-propeller protein